MESKTIAPATEESEHEPQNLSLECSVCGYGAARPAPPERCPMCQGEGTWIHTPWRPFSRARLLTG
jgi:rubrerythrin